MSQNQGRFHWPLPFHPGRVASGAPKLKAATGVDVSASASRALQSDVTRTFRSALAGLKPGSTTHAGCQQKADIRFQDVFQQPAGHIQRYVPLAPVRPICQPQRSSKPEAWNALTPNSPVYQVKPTPGVPAVTRAPLAPKSLQPKLTPKQAPLLPQSIRLPAPVSPVRRPGATALMADAGSPLCLSAQLKQTRCTHTLSGVAHGLGCRCGCHGNSAAATSRLAQHRPGPITSVFRRAGGLPPLPARPQPAADTLTIQRRILVVQPAPPQNANKKQRESYNTVVKSATNLQTRLQNKGTQEAILYESQIVAASLANVSATEKLYIVAHGDGKTVGKKTPQELAKLLVTTGGLRDAKAITVLACLSYYTEARTGTGGMVQDETFTKKLAAEIRSLVPQGSALIGRNIKGRTGFVHLLDPSEQKSTRVRATTPEQVSAVMDQYTACNRQYLESKETYEQQPGTTPDQADEWAYLDYRACMQAPNPRNVKIKLYQAKAAESFGRVTI